MSPGFKDVLLMFKELIEGVRELGVGKCEVLPNYEVHYGSFCFGFVLFEQPNGDIESWWEFFINAKDFGLTKSKLPSSILTAISTPEGTCKVAKMIQEGFGIERMDMELRGSK
jgi:hypothetical protein